MTRLLLTAIILLCIPFSANAFKAKFNPGHYLQIVYQDTKNCTTPTTALNRLGDSANLEGVNIMYSWKCLQDYTYTHTPSSAVYDWTQIDADLAWLAANYPTKKLAISVLLTGNSHVIGGLPTFMRTAFEAAYDLDPNDYASHPYMQENTNSLVQNYNDPDFHVSFKRWNATYAIELQELIKAMGQRYNSNSTVELFMTAETASAMPCSGAGYTAASMITELKKEIDNMATYWPDTNTMIWANFVSCSSASQRTDATTGLYSYAQLKDVGLGGPDITPSRDELVTGPDTEMAPYTAVRQGRAIQYMDYMPDASKASYRWSTNDSLYSSFITYGAAVGDPADPSEIIQYATTVYPQDYLFWAYRSGYWTEAGGAVPAMATHAATFPRAYETVTPPSPAVTVPYYNNVGGPEFTGSKTWLADGDTCAGSGGTYSHSQAIAGTTDDTIFQTGEQGQTITCRVTIANDQYNVKICDAEHYHGVYPQVTTCDQQGSPRKFDVDIEGASVDTDLDWCLIAGAPSTLACKTYTNITVSDGYLDLVLSRGSTGTNPTLNVLEITEYTAASTIAIGATPVSFLLNPYPATTTVNAESACSATTTVSTITNSAINTAGLTCGSAALNAGVVTYTPAESCLPNQSVGSMVVTLSNGTDTDDCTLNMRINNNPYLKFRVYLKNSAMTSKTSFSYCVYNYSEGGGLDTDDFVFCGDESAGVTDSNGMMTISSAALAEGNTYLVWVYTPSVTISGQNYVRQHFSTPVRALK